MDHFMEPPNTGNAYIIGTMNTTDRSIALVDHALRRRFAFLQLLPNFKALEKYSTEHGFELAGLIEVLKRINEVIGDRNYAGGISYFMTENVDEELEDMWCLEILPYLEEFFFSQLDRLEEFHWDNVKDELTRA